MRSAQTLLHVFCRHDSFLILEYMDRAEKLKSHVESLKNDGNYKEQIKVEENSIHHSYASVFSRFLDPSVRNVEVDDPYIRSPHQVNY